MQHIKSDIKSLEADLTVVPTVKVPILKKTLALDIDTSEIAELDTKNPEGKTA